MTADPLAPLICDLLDWVAREPRSRADAMEAWRTACPRLTVWEGALEAGLIERNGNAIVVTTKGNAYRMLRRPAG